MFHFTEFIYIVSFLEGKLYVTGITHLYIAFRCAKRPFFNITKASTQHHFLFFSPTFICLRFIRLVLVCIIQFFCKTKHIRIQQHNYSYPLPALHRMMLGCCLASHDARQLRATAAHSCLASLDARQLLKLYCKSTFFGRRSSALPCYFCYL